MADKKLSVELTGTDRLSSVFEKTDKTLERLRKSAGDAGVALEKLKETQGSARQYRETSRAIEDINKALAENAKRTKVSAEALRAARSEQRRYQQGISAARKTLDELALAQAASGKLTREQRVVQVQATQAIKALQPALKKATAEVNAKRREDAAARRETDALNKTLELQRTRISRLGEALGGAGVDVNKLGDAERRLASETEKVTNALHKQETRIKSVSAARSQMEKNKAVRSDLVGQAMGTAAAAAPVVYSVKKAIDYEWSWADVQKVVNFKDDRQDAEFQRKIQHKAVELGMGQSDITEIVAAAGQAGVANDATGKVDTRQLERFTVDAAKMAVAFDSDARTAGDTMATIRTSLKLSQDQMMELADVINKESASMNAKAMVVTGIMRRQGANGGLAGFNYREVAGLASALVASGDTEETGATALKNITGRLTSGFSASKSQRTALGMLGFNPEILAKDMQRDATGTMYKVLTAINKQSPDKRKAIISQVFGEEVAGSVAKLAGNMNLLRQAMDIAGDKTAYAGSMEIEYQTKAQTRAFKLRQAQSAFEELTIALGSMLLPVVDELAPPITELAQDFKALLDTSPAAKATFGWIIKISAGLLALKAGLMIFRGVKSLFSDLIQLGKIGKNKLGMATDATVGAADRAARALARMNKQIDILGKNSGRGNSPVTGEPERSRSRPGRPRNRRRPRAGSGGRWAAVFDTAMMLLPSSDASGEENDAGPSEGKNSAFLPQSAKTAEMMQTGAAVLAPFSKGISGKALGRVFMPLQALSGGLNIANTYAQGGSAAEVGRAAGDAAGGLGGGLGGAALGATIGTMIFPGVGTAIGGALGGIAGSTLGSSLGASLGESVGPWVEKTFGDAAKWFTRGDEQPASAEKVAKISPTNLVKANPENLTPAIDASVKAQTVAQTIAPAPTVRIEHNSHFDVKASGDPAQDNALVQKIKAVIEQLNADMFASGMAAATSGVDARLNASLSGQRSD